MKSMGLDGNSFMEVTSRLFVTFAGVVIGDIDPYRCGCDDEPFDWLSEFSLLLSVCILVGILFTFLSISDKYFQKDQFQLI